MEQLRIIRIALQIGDLHAACDGSFDVDYGSTVWCIGGNGAIIIDISILPIGSDTMDATRCALGRVFIILRIIACLTAYYELNGGKIGLRYECGGELKRTLVYWKKFKTQFVSCIYLDIANSINTMFRIVFFDAIDNHVPRN